jgi:CRISPR-associated protein Csh2
MMHIKGTGAFASKEGSKQATFREEDFLPYSLISFYGIVNENAAKHTHLTEDDLKLLLEGIWNGTKSLISRSKAGQVPRLLLKVNYSKENYHIGDLDKMLKLVTEMPHENIRDTTDYQIEISELVRKLSAEKGSIKDMDICVDGRIKFCIEGASFPIEGLAAATGIAIKPIVF